MWFEEKKMFKGEMLSVEKGTLEFYIVGCRHFVRATKFYFGTNIHLIFL
jgi:hypothetical protein